MTYLKKHTDKTKAPASRKISPNMVKNDDGGGYVFKLDKWKTFDRFLVLGTEGGSYYASESKMTDRCFKIVDACLKEDGIRAINRAVEISHAGRAPKNDQAVLILARASVHDNPEVRKAAYNNLHNICRTGTHLYQFTEFRKNFDGGWGKGMRTAVSNWFTKKAADKVALQVAKYKQREGWSARDLLRLAHPVPPTPEHEAIFNWVVGDSREDKDGNKAKHLRTYGEEAVLPAFLQACDEIADCKNIKRAVKLIREYGLPREVVPTELLNEVNVWEALLESMPMTAMVRNLGKMSSVGLLKTGSAAAIKVCNQLTNEEILKASRMHPINMLMAMKTYSGGHGIKGSLTWNPVRNIIDAMDDAFYLCFQNVEPMNVPTILALDVSASMTWSHGTSGLTPREVSAAMAMITLQTEKHDCTIVGFSHDIVQIPISRKDSLSTVISKIERIPMGSTNIAAPMAWAQKNKIPADGFMIYTDNELNCGGHPNQTIKAYRQAMGRQSKMIVCAVTATPFTVADPKDPLCLDIAGFDSATPSIISDFVAGRI